MKVPIALTDFNILRPSYEVNQSETLELLSQAHTKMALVLGEENYTHELLKKMFNRFGLKPEQVSKRGLESHDMSFNVRSILERTRFFSEKANSVLDRFYPEGEEAPGHLIHVTCTGYVSPSPAQFLIQKRGWSEETKVTHAYHMGCYASIPSIRIAQGFLQNDEDRVDLVHTEMCSIHLNPAIHSPEQIVVQSLFADGYIKYSAVPAESVNKGIKLITTLEKIIPNSAEDMSWITADWGMHMTLSRDVPEKIVGELMNFVKVLCQKGNYDFQDIHKKAIFAVHPGGPKIIDSVQKKLELDDWQVSASKEILFQYGNMSSATLPHVWNKILENEESKKVIISLAFGPGLTMFGAIFEII